MKNKHNTWQPIETAPTNIPLRALIFCPDNVGHWKHGIHIAEFTPDTHPQYPDFKGLWWATQESIYSEEPQTYTPTHWMPLPEPPLARL